MKIRVLLAMGALCLLGIQPVGAQGTTATAPGSTGGMAAMDPAMRQRMIAFVQDVMIMTQNTATETPDGLIVLQGNNLLNYSKELRLLRTVPLPVPPMAATGTATTPGTMPGKPLRSMMPAKIISASGGDIIVIRGQQIIRLDRELRIRNQAMLPDLAPLTAAELAVVAPIGAYMATMPIMGMGMPGMGMPPDTTMPPPAAGGTPAR